jgi:predicted ribosomally synthesized peptide with SipW-like signal peptide
MNGMTTRRKLFLTLGVIAVMGVAVFGTFAAFTATSTNSGNQIASGTVKIDDQSGATTELYDVANAAPGAATSACIRITYDGSLASSVKLYLASAVSNGSDFTLQIERGSGLSTVDGTRSCADFSPSSTAYSGDLDGLGGDYAAGVDGKAAGAAWSQGHSVDYRFTVTAKDDSTPNAHTTAVSSGAHAFTWEARNN